MNSAFSTYFQETFFPDKKDFNAFIGCLTKPIKRSIRVNTSKISVKDLITRLRKQGYILTPTFNPTIFYIERGEDFIPMDTRLGYSIEHLTGLFYIQELGASSSVHYLTDGKIHSDPFLILDLASSPGGKTTQLAEHYPNAFIIANDASNDRIAQLISNVERMGCSTIGITHYPWAYYGRFVETFDRVLLDAPCSGEGTGFKSLDGLKYWSLKNVKKIAKIQTQLFEAGLVALKVGGEMLYSTCTMNALENEWIIEAIATKYPESFEIVFQKRFWPHIDETWGFFVCRIRKIKSIELRKSDRPLLSNTGIKNLSSHEENMINEFSKLSGLDLTDYRVFKYEKDVLITNKSAPYRDMMDTVYFLRFGKRIGSFEWSEFIPNWHTGRDFLLPKLPIYIFESEQAMDNYLRGVDVIVTSDNPYVRFEYEKISLGLGLVKSDTRIAKNLVPKQWLKK